MRARSPSNLVRVSCPSHSDEDAVFTGERDDIGDCAQADESGEFEQEVAVGFVTSCALESFGRWPRRVCTRRPRRRGRIWIRRGILRGTVAGCPSTVLWVDDGICRGSGGRFVVVGDDDVDVEFAGTRAWGDAEQPQST